MHLSIETSILPHFQKLYNDYVWQIDTKCCHWLYKLKNQRQDNCWDNFNFSLQMYTFPLICFVLSNLSEKVIILQSHLVYILITLIMKVHHNFFITLLLRSMLVKQGCYIQTKIYRINRRMTISWVHHYTILYPKLFYVLK